jgi:hypothetical protein
LFSLSRYPILHLPMNRINYWAYEQVPETLNIWIGVVSDRGRASRVPKIGRGTERLRPLAAHQTIAESELGQGASRAARAFRSRRPLCNADRTTLRSPCFPMPGEKLFEPSTGRRAEGGAEAQLRNPCALAEHRGAHWWRLFSARTMGREIAGREKNSTSFSASESAQVFSRRQARKTDKFRK